MENHSQGNDHSLTALIELGKRGTYPLFERSWIDNSFEEPESKSNSKQKAQVNKLLLQLSKHKTIERKKVLLFAMSDLERNLLIREFFKRVEGRILDDGMELH